MIYLLEHSQLNPHGYGFLFFFLPYHLWHGFLSIVITVKDMNIYAPYVKESFLILIGNHYIKIRTY